MLSSTLNCDAVCSCGFCLVTLSANTFACSDFEHHPIHHVDCTTPSTGGYPLFCSVQSPARSPRHTSPYSFFIIISAEHLLAVTSHLKHLVRL